MLKPTGREFTIRVPIYVTLGRVRKKKFYLNLNLLRNRVAHLNNNIKKEFKNIVAPLIPEGVFYEKFTLHYELYLPNKLHRDISNVLSIVDKNFCDAFIESGHGIDDSYEYVQDIRYTYGGMDEDKEGYCLVTVKEVA